eukprot:Nk52_evm30s2531 gene=Nk52_evmTU30s2531
MKNLTLTVNGGSLEDFTSQYHHESRCCNLLTRDSSLVWFTHVAEQLPQHVIFKLCGTCEIRKIGIYLHGENNQSPKHLEIHLSLDNVTYKKVTDTELEHRAGDHLFDLEEPVMACYAKFVVTENFGGSGIYISRCFVFGRKVGDYYLSPQAEDAKASNGINSDPSTLANAPIVIGN